MKKILYVVMLLGFILPFNTHAIENLRQLDQAIQDALTEANVPGASAVVIEDGRITLHQHYGVSDIYSKKAVDDSTIFRAGSISKSFTALGVMILVEQGLLSLETPVSNILPTLEIDNPWKDKAPVRVVHLLEHTAGFNDIAFHHYLIAGSQYSIADAVELYKPYQSRWRPGTRTSYSNSGPVIAGLIIETISGQSFEDFMSQYFLKPLAMNNTTWRKTEAHADRFSTSYRYDGKTTEKFMEIPGKPSGSLNTTAIELAQLPLLMLARGTINGQELISAESISRIETPKSNNAAAAGLTRGYGLGNNIQLDGKSNFYGHEGSIDGFVASARYSPSLNAGYVIMMNATSSSMTEVSELIRTYLEKDSAATSIVSSPLDQSTEQQLTGQYQTITPRRHFLAPLIGLSQWQGVSFKDGILKFKGHSYEHLGANIFKSTEQSDAGFVFIENEDGIFLQGGESTYRKVSSFEMWSKVIILSIIALSALVSGVLFVVWLVKSLIGSYQQPAAVYSRLIPCFAFWFALAAGLAPLMLFGTADFELLGTANIMSILVLIITAINPFFVLGSAAVFVYLTANDTPQRFVKYFNSMQLILAGIMTIYYIHGDWFALKMWLA